MEYGKLSLYVTCHSLFFFNFLFIFLSPPPPTKLSVSDMKPPSVYGVLAGLNQLFQANSYILINGRVHLLNGGVCYRVVTRKKNI